MATAREVQIRLAQLGYYVGKIDGDLGPASCAAVMEALLEVRPKTEALPGPKDTPPHMTTSPAGRQAIAEREGNRLLAYRDSVGILTIGVGHTSAAGDPHVTPGMRITPAESDAILTRDLAKFEKAVRDVVKVSVTQNQFDALVSLAFNIGGGAFAGSSIVRKLNAGDEQGAADAFLRWDHAGGRVLAGLTKRRNDERKQFLGI